MTTHNISDDVVEQALVAFCDSWDKDVTWEDMADPDTAPNKTMRAALDSVLPQLFTEWMVTELLKMADEYSAEVPGNYTEMMSLRHLFSRHLRRMAMEYQEGVR